MGCLSPFLSLGTVTVIGADGGRHGPFVAAVAGVAAIPAPRFVPPASQEGGRLALEGVVDGLLDGGVEDLPHRALQASVAFRYRGRQLFAKIIHAGFLSSFLSKNNCSGRLLFCRPAVGPEPLGVLAFSSLAELHLHKIPNTLNAFGKFLFGISQIRQSIFNLF